MPWTLTVRVGPRVERARYAQLDDALDALERRATALARHAAADEVDTKIRRFAPVEQVSARLELSGPQRLLSSVRVGVDVRGDGSAEAFRGRVNRQLLEQHQGETPFGALRRAVSS